MNSSRHRPLRWSEMIWDDCFSCHGSFLISWGAGWTQCNFCCVWNISRLRIVQSTMWQLGGGALANDSLDTWKWWIRIRSYQIYKPCHPAASVTTIVSTRAVLRIDTAETKQHWISASRLSAWLSPGRDRIRDRKTLRRKKRPGLGQTTWKKPPEQGVLKSVNTVRTNSWTGTDRERVMQKHATACNSCLNIWEGHVSLIHSFRTSKTSQDMRLTVERFKLLGASRSHLELSQRLGSQLSPSTPLQSCENQCQSADQLLVCMCVCVSNNCMNRKVNPGTGCGRKENL